MTLESALSTTGKMLTIWERQRGGFDRIPSRGAPIRHDRIQAYTETVPGMSG